MTDEVPMTATDPTRPVDATAVHDFAVGDEIVYNGTLGEHHGVVAEVRQLADAAGTTLRAFVVRLSTLGHVLTSGDALRPARRATPAHIEIPRSAYADTSVPQRADAPATAASPEVRVDTAADADRTGTESA